jgi:NADH-quinone oxidoreductase subunit C/D
MIAIWCVMDEMRESLRILQQVLPYLDETRGGRFLTVNRNMPFVCPRAGESYGRVENPKGELGFYVTTKRRESNPERYHVRAPSFINLTALEKMCEGL